MANENLKNQLVEEKSKPAKEVIVEKLIEVPVAGGKSSSAMSNAKELNSEIQPRREENLNI